MEMDYGTKPEKLGPIEQQAYSDIMSSLRELESQRIPKLIDLIPKVTHCLLKLELILNNKNYDRCCLIILNLNHDLTSFEYSNDVDKLKNVFNIFIQTVGD